MSSYFIENIERITEQMIEQEICEDVEKIRVDANSKINEIKDGSIDFIEKEKVAAEEFIVNEKNDAIKFIGNEESSAVTFIENTEQSALDFIAKEEQEATAYIENEKQSLLTEFSETSGIIKELNDLNASTSSIYEKTLAVSGNTIDAIESNIRNMMVENGYGIAFSDDNNGNITMAIKKVN